jgi:hypothetical protein
MHTCSMASCSGSSGDSWSLSKIPAKDVTIAADCSRASAEICVSIMDLSFTAFSYSFILVRAQEICQSKVCVSMCDMYAYVDVCIKARRISARARYV